MSMPRTMGEPERQQRGLTEHFGQVQAKEDSRVPVTQGRLIDVAPFDYQ